MKKGKQKEQLEAEKSEYAYLIRMIKPYKKQLFIEWDKQAQVHGQVVWDLYDLLFRNL